MNKQNKYIDRDYILRTLASMDYPWMNFEDAYEIVQNTPIADVVETIYSKWELYDDNEDGFSHHRCSNCKEDAVFTYETEPMYDEGYDGEWHYVTDICVDINEHLTKFCPHCGVKMEETKK